MSFLVIWFPPLAWMAIVFWFSTGEFSTEHTAVWFEPWLRWVLPWATAGQIEAIHALGRKGAHVTEYAILAALWLRALRRGPPLAPRAAARVALAIAVAWAFVDEGHQALLLERGASALDVVIDSAGALAALVLARAGWRRGAEVAASALLWLAAVGGAGLIAVNLAAGVSSGVLWVTAPAAALLLAWRRRRSAAPR